MILVSERAEYLRVFKAHFKPKLSVEEIGTMRKLSGVWALETKTQHAMTILSEQLDGSEMRQIIGMLDKLNSITGRNQDDSLRRWREIIGLPAWVPKSSALLSDEEWADISDHCYEGE